jgi:hypothetical protein
MFTFRNDYTVTLRFKNEFIDLECRPENPTEIQEDGFDSGPSNGEFYFYYNDDVITFAAARYGDGNGGNLNVTLKMTPEIKESLEVALKEWRIYLKRKDEEA